MEDKIEHRHGKQAAAGDLLDAFGGAYLLF